MASSAERHPSPARRRSDLTDSGAQIESIPLLGTTWYRRGPAYWLRRLGFSLGMLVLAGADVAFLSWIIVPMLQKPSDRALGVVLLVVVVAIGIGMVAWMFRRGRGVQNRANSNRSIAAGGAAGGVVGSLLLIGSGLGFVLFFLGTVVSAGPLLAIFVLSLEPELYLERRARARLDRAS